MSIKRWLYLSHRWLGIALCLLFAMWFFTGVVMMYVAFPSLSEEERLAGLPAIDPHRVQASVGQLLDAVGAEVAIQSLRLTTVLGRPAYLLRTGDGAQHGLFADDGAPFADFDSDDALVAARHYHRAASGEDAAGAESLGLVEMDQWSLSSSLRPHRPLYHVALNDEADTRLYISSLTGEVVRDTSARERAWNWLGANLHWLYPLVLRRHGELWSQVVIVLSLLGLVSIATGAAVGLMRLRIRNPYRGRDITPYRGAMKLHHLLGLASLLFLTTFMLSGLLSMNPWNVFTSQQPFGTLLREYRGNPVADSAQAGGDPPELRQLLTQYPHTREVVWQWLAGEPYLILVEAPYQRRTVVPGQDDQLTLEQHAREQLGEIMAGATVTTATTLNHYDNYYYSHHQRWRPLPVLRVIFDDDEHSWFHIDLTTGELINRLTTKGRAQRWLYNGLHSLDFIALIQRRPLWDVVVIALSVLGFVFSVTSVQVAWRRLRPKARRRQR
ncbi:MAG: PepSY domain-containing protein [Porticoccaceae bacterium]|nr:PepSY domain-containing protein [Porticoccaceae bacterium]